MVVGLTGGETVLLVVALVFIAFALVVSMVIPRSRPDFPGDRLGLFVFVSLILFAAVAATVVATAGGEGHERAETEAAATEPAETEETETGEETGTTGTEPEPGQGGAGDGDAAAGEGVFASAGCGGCHVLAAADASGTIGPNLDESQPSFDLVVDRVTNGMGAMPAFDDRLSEEEIRNVAAYVTESTSEAG